MNDQQKWEEYRGVILNKLKEFANFKEEDDWSRFDEIFSYKNIYDLLMDLNIK